MKEAVSKGQPLLFLPRYCILITHDLNIAHGLNRGLWNAICNQNRFNGLCICDGLKFKSSHIHSIEYGYTLFGQPKRGVQ